MSAGHSEPQVLFSVSNITAYAVQNGEEHLITTSGPQTLSLLMVPTASPFADLSSAEPSSSAPEEDFYLHLHLPPELDLPLPASTQVYHKPPSSYLIPRWDLGPDAGAFIRIQFPSVGSGPGKVAQEEIDTFETILAQCTAFLERATSTPNGFKQYDPQEYRPGEGYISSGATGKEQALVPHQHGQIVLIDEENGSVIGELQDNYDVVESTNIKPGSKSEFPAFVHRFHDRQLTLLNQHLFKSSCLKRDKGTRYESTTYPSTSLKWRDIRHIKNLPSCNLQRRRRGC